MRFSPEINRWYDKRSMQIKVNSDVAFCLVNLSLSAVPAIPPCPALVSPSNSCELVSGVTSDRVQRSWDTGHWVLAPCYVSVTEDYKPG